KITELPKEIGNSENLTSLDIYEGIKIAWDTRIFMNLFLFSFSNNNFIGNIKCNDTDTINFIISKQKYPIFRLYNVTMPYLQ
ncbi:hypothetical protein PIROE2DRAFT_12972, partial [Piromyces sp. E2]